ncbi:unnamed protein product [Natator depressus]
MRLSGWNRRPGGGWSGRKSWTRRRLSGPRKELLELEALSAAVESAGAARAEAQSKAEAARIAGEAAVEQAKLKAEAAAIETT